MSEEFSRDPEAPGPPTAPEPGEPSGRAAADHPYSGFRPAEFQPAVFTPGRLDAIHTTSSEPAPAERIPTTPVREPESGLPTAWPPPVPALAGAGAETHVAFHRGPSTLARIGEELVAWFRTLFSAAVYATLIVTFGFQVARVEGLSMAPTLEDQDRLIVDKLSYRLHDPQVGDIVMLYYPVEPEKSFVKRVVGEPGDTLRSVQGRVYRNDVPLSDDFIPEEYRDRDTWGPEIVKPGHYFVMGDHRNNSSDSRSWGNVPKKYIIGKVQLRWWPLTHARLF